MQVAVLPCAPGVKQFISFGTIVKERVFAKDDMMSPADT